MSVVVTQQRAMIFVDGSNLLLELGTVLNVQLRADRPNDHALNLATQCIHRARSGFVGGGSGSHRIIRSYWFGSVQGSAEDIERQRTILRNFGHEAMLFPKIKGKQEKGVDLAVAREMLIHAFNKNYETAILVAGDADYVELVADIKRLGRSVVGFFFDGVALSSRLRVAFDEFHALPHPQGFNPELVSHVVGNSGPS